MALLHELGALDPAAEPRKRLTRARPPARAAPRRPAHRADGAGGRPARLRGRGHRHRRRAVDPGPARAPGSRSARPADQQHARFADEGSDFLAYLQPLAPPARAPARAVAQRVSQELPRRVPALPARARVAGPRRPAAPGGARRRRDDQPASRPRPTQVHLALLSGLLSHVGLRDAAPPRRVRGRARRALRALARLGARAQAAGVGDGRRARRDDAAVGPHGRADPAARGSSRSPGTCSSARTPSRTGSASAGRSSRPSARRCSGCRSSPGARSPTGDRPACCRASCSSAARWSRATGRTRHRFVADNAACSRRSRSSSTARAGATSSPATQALFDFYDERIPADVVSGAHFDRWWKDARGRDPQLLHFTRELLVDGDARTLDRAALPDSWRQGELTLALSYRFEPGSSDDGITVHVPLDALARAARRRLRLARAGAARGARHRADPLAAQGPAPPARADPRDGARRSWRACARAAARLVDAVARELERAARRARRARTHSTSRGCPRTCG